MQLSYKSRLAVALVLFMALGALPANGQATSGSISGTVLDPSGAVVENAVVHLHNPVSGLDRTAGTDSKGNFTFSNVPYNSYHLSVTSAGFAPMAQDVEVRSVVPVNLSIALEVTGGAQTVTVEAAGEPVIVVEFAGDSGNGGSCGRLERPVPRHG